MHSHMYNEGVYDDDDDEPTRVEKELDRALVEWGTAN